MLIVPHRSNQHRTVPQDGRVLRRYKKRWVVERSMAIASRIRSTFLKTSGPRLLRVMMRNKRWNFTPRERMGTVGVTLSYSEILKTLGDPGISQDLT